ncbi:DegQ family serine endoprotease [Hoeflea prorocentri]|uniref:Probable periplasmic serine endoprotease DegP-like n=1 Tax=Hoeflea prorocentri TaxID=1922333 RepID=A0A9X3UFQ6_9HYPH|nr:DegQ family serine endoprotease [Hoeflea prorocentri]MCY6379973.1 DegQ family serine endoprotease [Hoeflea prorocentri]MDA5397773.1 DegQ family serine endoprotease [Hoeflea prorocentri]
MALNTILRPFRTVAIVAALGVAAVHSGGVSVRTAEAAQGPESVADLAEGLLDSVVNISTSQRVSSNRRTPRPRIPEGSPFQDFFDEFFGERDGDQQPRSRRVNSLGSGFVIDAQGIIVTNNHVIAEADDIEVNFADGTKLTAEVVGADPKTDIAVLKVEPEQPLTAVPFGDSNALRIGDWVMAIGNPFGLGGTVTTGIVSARGRDINSGPYDNFIQTDAAINRGNSGGPLFNQEGEVIGVNTAIISPTGGSIGIGFAVPSDLVQTVVAQLREFGETRRGWLGVRIQPVTDDIAESLDMAEAKGALVAGIIKGGPVDNGTVEPGDVIIRFDGQEVEDMRDLPRIVAESPVGKEVEVVLIRKGEEKIIKVTLGRLEDGEQLIAQSQSTDEPQTATVLGMDMAELDSALREKYEIEEGVEGVVIVSVEENSAAAEKRIVAGDVIVEVAQEEVKTPQDVKDRVKELTDDGRRNALLMIANKTGELRFITVPMR